MDTLQIHEPVHVHDLPTGAPRWDQKVTGCELQPPAAVHFPAAGCLNRSCCWLRTDEYTILNGEVTFMDGQHTGALPGGLVRRQGRRPGVKTGVLPEPPAWSRGESYRPGQLTGADGSTADTALQASLDSESGISNQSRIAEALEKEEAEKKSQAAKL